MKVAPACADKAVVRGEHSSCSLLPTAKPFHLVTRHLANIARWAERFVFGGFTELCILGIARGWHHFREAPIADFTHQRAAPLFVKQRLPV